MVFFCTLLLNGWAGAQTPSQGSIQAQAPRSQALFIPPAGQYSLQSVYAKGFDGLKPPDTHLEAKLIKWEWLRGGEENSWWGLSFNDGDEVVSSPVLDRRATGLSDLWLRWGQWKDWYFYGVDLGLSFEEKKTALNSQGRYESNRFSGGPTLAPMVGLFLNNETLNIGIKAQYFYLGPRKEILKDSISTNHYQWRNGHYLYLRPFMEFLYENGIFSAELFFGSFMTSEKTDDSGQKTIVESDDHKIFQLTGTYDVDPQWTLLFQSSFKFYPSEYDDSGKAVLEAYSLSQLSGGVRYLF